jgi:hypothetical protein
LVQFGRVFLKRCGAMDHRPPPTRVVVRVARLCFLQKKDCYRFVCISFVLFTGLILPLARFQGVLRKSVASAMP